MHFCAIIGKHFFISCSVLTNVFAILHIFIMSFHIDTSKRIMLHMFLDCLIHFLLKLTSATFEEQLCYLSSGESSLRSQACLQRALSSSPRSSSFYLLDCLKPHAAVNGSSLGKNHQPIDLPLSSTHKRSILIRRFSVWSRVMLNVSAC